MALVVFMCGEQNARTSSFRAERKPWMLKDYLGDDLSSCSSNGFRSFPRRQCCVAVRNIIEKEVARTGRINNNHSKAPKRMLVRNRSISSTLQRASMAVINAVKFLPFGSDSKTSSQLSDGNRFLSRSFSKKLIRKSFFWKKERKITNHAVVIKKSKDDHEKFEDEIEEWISSGVVGKEKYQPLDLSNDTTVTTVSTTSISNSDGKSDSSWSDDITFTSDSSENDVVEDGVKIEIENEEVSNCDGVLTGEASVGPAEFVEETLCLNEEAEKEQSSPVSILDFPYDHDDNGDSSPFTLRVSRLKGSTERLKKKLGRFECLAGLEPINLETLISSIEIEDRSPKCSIQPCSTPSYVLSSESEEEEEESHENEVEKHAQNLLNITKAKMGPKITHIIELENLLLDFFRENVTQKTNDNMLKGVEDWLNGHYDELILGWEVEDKRMAYIRNMDESGWWPRDTKLEREEVASKLGDEVLAYLIQEFMIELSSS